MREYIYHTLAPKMPKRETEELILALKEIRDHAEMRSADFFTFDPEREKKNAEIKENTRLYRQAWIVAPLEQLIARYERALKSKEE